MICVSVNSMKATSRTIFPLAFALIVGLVLISSCKRSVTDYTPWRVSGSATPVSNTPQPPFTIEQTATLTAPQVFPTSVPQVTLTLAPVGIQPTPNAPMALPALRTSEDLLSAGLDWAGGTAPDETLVRRFGELVAQAADPIDDVRGSAAYRRHALAVMARRTLGWAWSDYRRRWAA